MEMIMVIKEPEALINAVRMALSSMSHDQYQNTQEEHVTLTYFLADLASAYVTGDTSSE